MASSKITLDVGTKYNGEGMKKLDNSIKSSSARMKRSAKDWGNAHKSAAKTATLAWTEFYSKVKVITGAISIAWGALKSVLSKPFDFETQTQSFKMLIGNIDEAKAHMQDLKELGDTPPFSLDEFAKASRQLMVMTDGIMGAKGSLEMIGDVAAATGNDLETLSHSVGLLYAMIRDGQPIGRAATQLRNIGVLTPEVVKQLDDMQKAGASSVEVWEAVEKALKKYEGAMAETESTGNGLIGAIGSKWDNIVRQFGDAFTDVAHSGLKDALEAMQRLEDSGFARWLGDTVLSALTKVTNAVTALYTQLKEGYQFWKDFFGGAKEGAEGAAEEIKRTLVEEKNTNEYTTMRKYQRDDGTEEYEYEIDEKKKKAAEDKQRKEAEQKKMRDNLLQKEREREEKQTNEGRANVAKKIKEETGKTDAMLSNGDYTGAKKHTQEREDIAKKNLSDVQDEIAKLEAQINDARKNVKTEDIKIPAPKINQKEITVPEPRVKQNDVKVPEPKVERQDVKIPTPNVEQKDIKVPEPKVEQKDIVVPTPTVEQKDIKVPEPKVEQKDVKVEETSSTELVTLNKKLRALKEKEFQAQQELTAATKESAKARKAYGNELEVQNHKDAQAFIKAQEAEEEAARKAQERAEAQQKIIDAQNKGAEIQQNLNDQIAQAKNAVNDWIANFNNINLNGNGNGGQLKFADFNKQQNQQAQLNAVPLMGPNGQQMMGPNGQPLAMNNKQANAVKANQQQLERLQKIKNPDARTKKEIERRQAFDDQFNPAKLQARQDALKKAEEEKAKALKDMQDNIKALKKLLVDQNGVAL